MCGGRNRTKRRPAQDVLVAAIVKQKGEVGRAAPELAHSHGILSTGQLAAQECLDCAFVKTLIGADADCI